MTLRRKPTRPQYVQDVCACCAPKPDPSLHGHPPSWYVGRYVKQAFEGQGVEHMWIRVTGLADVAGSLRGTMASKPTLVPDLRFGDVVTVRIQDIEAIEGV
jgi:hypothetical protein